MSCGGIVEIHWQLCHPASEFGRKHAGEKRIRDDEAEKGTTPQNLKGEEPSSGRRKSPRSALKTGLHKDQLWQWGLIRT